MFFEFFGCYYIKYSSLTKMFKRGILYLKIFIKRLNAINLSLLIK